MPADRHSPGLCLVNLAQLDPPRNGGLSRVAQHVSRLLLDEARRNRRFIPLFLVNADFAGQFPGWIGSDDALILPYDHYAPPLGAFGRLRSEWIVGPLFGVRPLQLFSEFTGIPQIVMMPDTLALDHPEMFQKAGAKVLWQDYRPLRQVERVVTLSEFSRGQLIRQVGLAAERVSAVGLGADGFAGEKPADDPLPYPYVFYPANAWPHKRHGLLFQAMRHIWPRRPDLHLVLTGKHSADMGVDIERIMRETGAPAERVHDLGYVADGALAGLYGHAEALLFVSAYEGFGMPLVEAMLSGCPVMCAPLTSIPEVAGEAALYVDSDDPERWAAAFLDELPGQRETLTARGRERASQFTWERMRKAWADILREFGIPLQEAPADEAARQAYWEAEDRLKQIIQPADGSGSSTSLLQYARYVLRRGFTSRSGRRPDLGRALRTLLRMVGRKPNA